MTILHCKATIVNNRYQKGNWALINHHLSRKHRNDTSSPLTSAVKGGLSAQILPPLPPVMPSHTVCDHCPCLLPLMGHLTCRHLLSFRFDKFDTLGSSFHAFANDFHFDDPCETSDLVTLMPSFMRRSYFQMLLLWSVAMAATSIDHKCQRDAIKVHKKDQRPSSECDERFHQINTRGKSKKSLRWTLRLLQMCHMSLPPPLCRCSTSQNGH